MPPVRPRIPKIEVFLVIEGKGKGSGYPKPKSASGLWNEDILWYGSHVCWGRDLS